METAYLSYHLPSDLVYHDDHKSHVFQDWTALHMQN